MSPFEALYGVCPPLHISYIPEDSYVVAVDINLRDREAATEILKHHLSRASIRMKNIVDRKRSER